MSGEQVKSSERPLKKQEISRPTSILPAISPSAKQDKSVDSTKSSRTSSRISTASSKSSSKRTEKKDPNDNLNLIIFGSSALPKTNPQSNGKKMNSKISLIKEEKHSSSDKNEEETEPSVSTHELPKVKKASRANSIPGPINRRYSIETSTIRQAKQLQVLKKSELNKCESDMESRSTECIFRENFSLDLSRMSDFADSEDETVECKRNSKQKLNKGQNAMRRRRSIDKERILSSKTISPRSIPKSLLTRRSSLQSVSSRGLSFTSSFDNAVHGKVGSTYSIKDYAQHDSPTNTLKTLKNAESLCSSPSPDYTSEPSTCDTSPCKLSNSPRISTFDKKYSSMDSNRATISPMSQIPCLSSSSSCYTSWMEKSVESELTCSRDNINNGTSAKERGEWNNFWRNYNSSLATFPKQFYDDCPTPFYESNEKTLIPNYDRHSTKSIIEEEDTNTNSSDGRCVHLSRDEAKEMIHCARRLAEILTAALENDGSDPKADEKLKLNSNVKVNTGNEHKNGTTENVENSNENATRKNTFNNSEETNKKLDVVARMLLSGITTVSGNSKDVLL